MASPETEAGAGPSSTAPMEQDRAPPDEEDLEAVLEDALERQDGSAEAAVPGPPSAQQAAEALPLTAQGLVDVDRLTPAQRAQYNTALVRLMTDEQQERYANFRRSSLKKPMAKDKALLALASVSKTFVGEVVETARKLASERGDTGPLQPIHVHTAYQLLREAGKVEASRASGRRLRI